MKDNTRKVTVGVIGHIDHGKSTLTEAIHRASLNTSYPKKYTSQELQSVINNTIEAHILTNNKNLADSIIETTANLKGKQLSARALRRVEARKLKPKYR